MSTATVYKKWTIPQLEAAISAVAAMLSGEEGEGDGADVKHDDLEGALVVLQQERGYMKRVQADQAKLRKAQGGK